MHKCLFRLYGLAWNSFENQQKDLTLSCFYPLQERVDKFEYLLILYRVWRDSTEELLQFRVQRINEFWKANKYLLNYVNAAYTLKEFIECYAGTKSPIYKPVDQAFHNCEWFRTLCEYRNRIIHQTNIIKDYDPQTGKIYICWDDFIKAQESHFATHGAKAKDKELFLERIKNRTKDTICIGTGHFFEIEYFVTKINEEFAQVLDAVLISVFDLILNSAIISLLDLTYKFNGIFCDTQYWYSENDMIAPNRTIETAVVDAFLALGMENALSKKIVAILKENDYFFFYSYNCSIDRLVEALELGSTD